MSYPCANSRCSNNVEKAGQYCPSCQKAIDKMIANVWKELEDDAQLRRRKREQDNAHKKSDK